MDTKITNFLNWFSRVCLYLVVFLVPLFFLPFTPEKFEINKNYLFYTLTVLSFISFLGRAVILKSFEIRRTILDRLFLVLWVIYLIISLLSVDKYLSFFGDLGFLSFSFVGFSISLIFYFLVVQHIDSTKRILGILYTLLLSGFLVGIYFLAQVWGLFSLLNLNTLVPNTVSNSNTALGVFLAFVFLASWAILSIRKHNFGLDVFAAVVWLVSLLGIVTIGFNIIWIILAVSLVIMLAFFFTHLEQTRTVGTSLGLIILVAGILFIILGEPKFLVAKLPVEISLGSNISWSLSYSAITSSLKTFLFGSGPATFVYDFSRFRPQEMNMNFVWNTRFNQPYNVVFEWLATHGVLASLAFLAIILVVFGVMLGTWLKQITEFKKKRGWSAEGGAIVPLTESPLLFWAISGLWLSSVISLFFINFGVTHWLIFWLTTALVLLSGSQFSKNAVKEQTISLKTAPQYAFLTSFLFILSFTFIIVAGVYMGRFYVAEMVYARSFSEPLDTKITSLQEASSLNPRRVLFYLVGSQALLNKASQVANATKDVNQVSQLVALAVNSAKIATDRAPNDASTWEFLSTMYANARSIAPEANNWVITSLERGVQLEPTNPTFYVGLGNAKLLEKRYSEAKDDFEKAIVLKPDFLSAYVSLAGSFEMQNKLDDSIATLLRGLSYGNRNPEYLFQLGRYYFNRKGKDDDGSAEIALTRAIQLNPNYPDALYALALLYERNGLKANALPLYQKILQLNPGNVDIKNKINNLNGLSAPTPTPIPVTTSTLPVAPPKK